MNKMFMVSIVVTLMMNIPMIVFVRIAEPKSNIFDTSFALSIGPVAGWSSWEAVNGSRKRVNSSWNICSLRGTPWATSPQSWFLSTSMTSHCKAKLFCHFRTQTLPEEKDEALCKKFKMKWLMDKTNKTIFLTSIPVIHSILSTVPTKLQNCNHDSQCKTTQQNHKNSSNVLNTQGMGFGVLALVLNEILFTSKKNRSY